MKKSKKVSLVVGIILFILWFIDLWQFVNWSKLRQVVQVGYFGLGWFSLTYFLIDALEKQKDQNAREDQEKTSHSCNICGNNLKIGQGKHYLGKDKCR